MRLTRKVAVRVVLPVTALALVAGTVAGIARHDAGGPAVTAAATVPDVSAGEGAALLADVQDASGAPLPGRDPSMEVQTSLNDAVSRSTLTSKPSAKVHDHPAMTAQEMAAMGVGTKAERKAAGARSAKKVLGNPAATHVLSNGCVGGYGRVDQCLPAHSPGGGVTTCAYVVTIFPQGVPVTGADVLGLDADGNGVACDAADLHHQH